MPAHRSSMELRNRRAVLRRMSVAANSGQTLARLVPLSAIADIILQCCCQIPSAHFQNNDLIAARIGCLSQFLDLICRYSSDIISPRDAHKRQDFRDLLIVQLNAELRHAIRIWHAFYDKWFCAVQQEIDERRRLRVEHRRVACQRWHEWRLASAVGAMT